MCFGCTRCWAVNEVDESVLFGVGCLESGIDGFCAGGRADDSIGIFLGALAITRVLSTARDGAADSSR